MIVHYRGRTWGDWGTQTIVQRAPGFEDLKAAAANLTGGGRGGATPAPLRMEASAPILDMVVFADTDEDMGTALDDIAAASYDADELADHPYDYQVDGSDQRTMFVRCTARQIPSDWTTSERMRSANVQLAFEANDPMTYGAEQTETLTQGDPLAITIDGWGLSERWRWIGHGPLTNPRLTLTAEGYDPQIIRYVGTVNPGQNLLVESTPQRFKTTVGGFDRYGRFDGGVHTIPPALIALPPGPVTVTMGGTGGGDGSFRWRGAKP